jgi:hypothetical protein
VLVVLANHHLSNQTARLLQQDDIQELLSYVEQVMAGEIVYESWFDENGIRTPLADYSLRSSHRELHPNIYTVYYSLTVIEANIAGDRGEMFVVYSIVYLDSLGHRITGRSSGQDSPDKWIIEKRDGRWVVADILWYMEWVSNS